MSKDTTIGTSAGDHHRVPHRVLRPRRGLSILDARELWDSRELFWRLGRRDVTLRYRQTALGVSWVVIQPLLAAGIFTIVFHQVAKFSTSPVPYFVFVVSGMIVWNAFSNTVTRASTSITANANIITKVFFPRSLLPLSTTMAAVIDCTVGWAMEVVLLLAFRQSIPLAMITFPLWLLATLLLAQGAGLAAAALNVSFRDIQYILPVLITFLLYATPIAYPLSHIKPGLRTLYSLNPLTGLLQGAHWALLPHQHLNIGLTIYAVSCSFVAFLVGSVIFERAERSFSDVI